MRKLMLALLLVSATAVGLNAQHDTSEVIMSSIPDTELKTLDGVAVSSAEVIEDTVPVLLVFWATYCKPCIKELDAINDIIMDWEEEIEFRIICISVDDSRSALSVKPMVNSRGWEFEFYLDANQDFKRLMNVTAPPHSFIINRDGEVVYQHDTYTEGDEEETYEELKKWQ